ncbi:putative acetyltransferase [Bacilli bacterium PM5-9]|nr:putative acetyltransferase [Bacilli bacterium PM5-9]
MIREFKSEDIDEIMNIWLASNIDAHKFIDEKYWISKYNDVKESILNAEIYVCDKNGIRGFVGIVDFYIAGLFVKKEFRKQGIGKELLEFIKEKRSFLKLDVYELNENALRFYLDNDFVVMKKCFNEETDFQELSLLWEDSKDN